MSNENDPFNEFDIPTQQPVQRVELEELIAPYKKNDDIKSLEKSMDKYDANTVSTQLVRQQLLNKILPDVLNMDLSETAETDPDLFAAKSKLIAEARSLLNDMDSVSNKHVSTKLKQKDSETQASIAFNAADLLNKIKLNSLSFDTGNITTDKENIDKILENKFEESGSVILDTELEMSSNMLPKPENDNH